MALSPTPPPALKFYMFIYEIPWGDATLSLEWEKKTVSEEIPSSSKQEMYFLLLKIFNKLKGGLQGEM